MHYRTLVALVLCLGLAGCSRSLEGQWSGTSDYFNAPFTMTIAQAPDGTLSGTYQDQQDKGTVDGTYNGEPACAFRVNFGDTGLLFDGQFQGRKKVVGTFKRTGGQHNFEMTKP
jgi:hypothetical protein